MVHLPWTQGYGITKKIVHEKCTRFTILHDRTIIYFIYLYRAIVHDRESCTYFRARFFSNPRFGFVPPQVYSRSPTEGLLASTRGASVIGYHLDSLLYPLDNRPPLGSGRGLEMVRLRVPGTKSSILGLLRL